MPTCESSLLIDADPAAVWNVLSNVAEWPHWLPTVTEVRPLDGSPIVEGRRFFVRQPSLKPNVWRVSRVDAPNLFVWETRSPGIRMIAEHAVVPRPGGSSSVSLRFSFFGPVGLVIGLVLRRMTARFLVREAAALKERVEQGRGPLERAR
jgi:hypothetical protein